MVCVVKSPSETECSNARVAPPDARASARLHINYRALLARSPDNVVLVDVSSGCLVDANHGACALFGMDEQTPLTRAFADLCPPFQPDGQASAQLLATRIERALAGRAGQFEAGFLAAGGRRITCEVRLLPLPAPHTHLLHVGLVDGTRRVLDDELRHGQNRLLEMIARGAALKADDAAQILARNLQRAARLVASFKQVAVDRRGSERRAFMLCELVAELLPPLRILARQRDVEIRTEVAPGLAMDSYPGPLAEVLPHLVDNCLVHAFASDARGTIVIGASAGPEASIVLSVADNGAGIAAPLMLRVYDRFVTTQPVSGGSGLGLHVVHNIVSGVLGGSIELDSEPGKGSTFRLRLPAIAPAMSGRDSG
nr:ATP-binding protein [Massilia sp. DJPM01]